MNHTTVSNAHIMLRKQVASYLNRKEFYILGLCPDTTQRVLDQLWTTPMESWLKIELGQDKIR